MMQIDEIRRNRQLLNDIDWNMTPEEAVRLYLEWGNNWARGNYVIRSKHDVSHYFVVNTWKGKPLVYLVRRNSEEAVELAEIQLPAPLEARFLDSVGHNKGVYALSAEVREWLQRSLTVN
jgi:hypothetical protein